MNEFFDKKSIPEDDDYVNPLAEMRISNPPVDWERGEYPAIDDIWSWLHLSMLHERLYGLTDNIPLMPEIIYIFRLNHFGNICYNRQFLRAYGFFKCYGTIDIKVVTQEEWLQYLTILVANEGINSVRDVFPRKLKPLQTKSHGNPRIQDFIQHLRPIDAEPVIFTKEKITEVKMPAKTFIKPTQPIIEPQISRQYSKDDFQISKTFDESLLSTSEKEKEIGNEHVIRPTIDFDYQEISRAVLPQEGEESIMGSGVSCGIIGEGGMAVVYKIRVEDLEMIRAGKVLIPGRISQSEQQALNLVARYRDEAKVTAQLHHTNIVVVHLFGKFRGLPYIEMEYVNGSNLRELIQRRGKAPIDLFSSLSVLSLRGLAYAHSQCITLNGQEHYGVMHRDIKPANLLIDMKKGNVKLTDFGLARPPAVSIHTMANNTLGTLGYMSPEQLESNDVDTRTDIYSFGATMYEMLTGVPLFPQDNYLDLMKARQANFYQPLTAFRKDIHKDLLHIIDKCITYNAAERTQSADTLMDYLEDFHRKVSKERPEAILQDYVLGKRYFDTNIQMQSQKKLFFGNLFKG